MGYLVEVPIVVDRIAFVIGLLTRALVRAPGVGGKPWLEAKDRLGDSPQAIEMFAVWLEAAGADPFAGALRSELEQVATRVRVWLVSRLALASDALATGCAAERRSARRSSAL